MLALVVMVLDGCNVIASLVCFLLPLGNCLKELAANEERRRLNFIKINASEQNSKLTDEEFSQIHSNNKQQHSAINIHVVYFVCYAISEVMSPLMTWLIGSFSWLIIRCFFTMGMLSKKIDGASRILDLIKTSAA